MNFSPVIDDPIWYEIREFVLATVTHCANKTAYDETDLSVAATKLSAWAWATAGYELTVETVFRPDVIANFIAVGVPEYKPSGRGNLRSQLLRMSEVLLPNSAQRKLTPLPPSDPTRPYKDKEIVSLRSWAPAQTTPARRTNAKVLLALGFGAGLSASEIGNVRARDLHIDDQGVVVHVEGERERDVPVLQDWESALVERSTTISPDTFAFRENHAAYYPNLVSNFVNRSDVTVVRPQTQRMRTTWILCHLGASSPLGPLMTAAGVDSLQALSRYLKFLQWPDSAAIRALLRSPNIGLGQISGERNQPTLR